MTRGHKKTAERRLPASTVPDANPVRCCFSDARRILLCADSCNRPRLERSSKGPDDGKRPELATAQRDKVTLDARHAGAFGSSRKTASLSASTAFFARDGMRFA